MKTTTISLLFILVQICGRKEVSACGRLPDTLVPLLTNAHATHRWPWHVAIYHQLNEPSPTYQCGGTLIGSKSILTAAHCVKVDVERVTVSLGRLLLNASESSASFIKKQCKLRESDKLCQCKLNTWTTGKGELSLVAYDDEEDVEWVCDMDSDHDTVDAFEVAEIIPHPSYNSENQDHDIAIISLATSAIFNNHVQPVCLWRADRTDLTDIVGKYGTVVGWGRTETGKLSNELRQTSLSVVSLTACLESNRGLFGRFLSDTNFCAGSRNGTSVCTGDSGGAMTFEVNGRYYIRGVVSVGASKTILERSEQVCDPMQYVIFTDIVLYLPWIRNLTKITANVEDCDVRVPCGWSEDSHHCTVALNNNILNFSPGCKYIFDEIPNPAVTDLIIGGESDVIPDVSDAAVKFRNLDSLVFENLSLRVVERDRLEPFRNIRNLKLSFNGISQLDSDTFDDLIYLVAFDLSYNKLTELYSDLFKKLEYLEFLDMQKNRLVVLPEDIFQMNWKLRGLRISFNQLKEVHGNHFKSLINLERLYMAGNKLETLPAQMFHSNKKIVTLDLSQNQLKELPVDFLNELINLDSLFLNTNRLKLLPADIFRMNSKLRELDLTQNQLKELHADLFKDLIRLKFLDVSKNRLQALPANIFRNNRELREISITRNQLKELHVDQFEQLHNLEKIDLNGNQLEIIPPGVFRENINLREVHIIHNHLKEVYVEGLRNLEILELRENELENLPVFNSSSKMRIFDLSVNQLTELHADLFKELVNVETVYLDTNRLKVLHADIFRNNGNLRKLDISVNQLTVLHADIFKGLTNIEILSMHTNQLQVLPADIFRNNGKLRELLLARNQFKELHVDQFEKLYNLEEIYLQSNQLEIIPPGIFRSNNKLTYINLAYNKIRKIEADFHRMTHPAIKTINLDENVCIDESCGSTGSCDVHNLFDIFDKIDKNC